MKPETETGRWFTSSGMSSGERRASKGQQPDAGLGYDATILLHCSTVLLSCEWFISLPLSFISRMGGSILHRLQVKSPDSTRRIPPFCLQPGSFIFPRSGPHLFRSTHVDNESSRIKLLLAISVQSRSASYTTPFIHYLPYPIAHCPARWSLCAYGPLLSGVPVSRASRG
jgi:hypothetical protein